MSNIWRPNIGARDFDRPQTSPGLGVPIRGGGEWGKLFRQNEQSRLKDAKISREIDYFWECQSRNIQMDQQKGGPPRKGQRFLDQEEKELFCDNHQLEGIDFAKYDSIQVQRQGRQSEHIPVLESFNQCFQLFELPKWLETNVHLLRYSTPTPVQKHAMPAGLVGRDVMCCAQTGSGKTAAFLLPLTAAMNQQTATGNLQITFQGQAAPAALIMAPTRELVSQIFLEARKFCLRSPFKPVQVYGGVDAKPQLKELSRGVDLIVATPGRLQDFVERETITLANVDYLVLDEADRMLDMGFEPQIRSIVERHGMPSKEHRQTMFFSATFPKEIQMLAQDFLYDYIWIAVGRVGAAASSVDQKVKLVESSREKINVLIDDISREVQRDADHLTVVFVAMKRTAAWLVRELSHMRIEAVAIHGDLSQSERENNLQEFKHGRSNILVATDVASRGLDIPRVHRVINYDLPNQIDDYVHRIGRTGRVGHRGNAISYFVRGSGTEGNSGIASDLLDRIEDAGQEAPQWLIDEVAMGGGRKKKAGGGGYGYGGRDVRNGAFGAGDGMGRRKGGFKGKTKGGKGGGGGGGFLGSKGGGGGFDSMPPKGGFRNDAFGGGGKASFGKGGGY